MKILVINRMFWEVRAVHSYPIFLGGFTNLQNSDQLNSYVPLSIVSSSRIIYTHYEKDTVCAKYLRGWSKGSQIKPPNGEMLNQTTLPTEIFWKHTVINKHINYMLYLRWWHSAKCFRSSAVDKRLCDICSVPSLGIAPAVMQGKFKESHKFAIWSWTTREYIESDGSATQQ